MLLSVDLGDPRSDRIEGVSSGVDASLLDRPEAGKPLEVALGRKDSVRRARFDTLQ